MKKTLAKLCWLPLVVVIIGCDTTSTPEPETTLRALAAASKDLADFLGKIQDANSAQAAIPDLDAKFTTFFKHAKELRNLLSIREVFTVYLANHHLFAATANEISNGTRRIIAEGERINALPGLPVEFWKAFTTCDLSLTLQEAEYKLGVQDARRPMVLKFLKDWQDAYQNHPYEEVVHIVLDPPDDEFVQKTCDKLAKLFPEATLHKCLFGLDRPEDVALYRCQFSLHEPKFEIVIAPVKDFNAVASGIDTGTIVVKNESKRYLKIIGGSSKHIDPDDLEDNSGDFGSLPKKAKKPPKRRPPQAPPATPGSANSQPSPADQQQQSGGTDEKKVDPLADQPGLDPKAPDFFDKLAERINSGDGINSEKAIDGLLQASPSGISLDTTKKIARAFKQLAESKGPAAKKGIRGLVVWGGKYSGPVLQKLLEQPQPANEEQLIEALGQVKHATAAAAIAARLGSFDLYQAAFNALQEMGPDAEDALLTVAPSQNPQIALAAVELLGLCGTQKSLSALDGILSHSHPKVREACKQSIDKIKERQKETKE